ncbi:MAG: DUF2977 domain-containing protein [Staphylococcus sp.]|nr:DUF2977 domain-containing protein [Staphylococcus sp.]
MEIYIINKEEIVLHLDGSEILGYTLEGGYDPSSINNVLLKRSQLPENFFREFASSRFAYYRDTDTITYNPDYIPPKSTSVEYDEEGSRSPVPNGYVPRKDYEELKSQLEDIKKTQEQTLDLLKQLLGQRG